MSGDCEETNDPAEVEEEVEEEVVDDNDNDDDDDDRDEFSGLRDFDEEMSQW